MVYNFKMAAEGGLTSEANLADCLNKAEQWHIEHATQSTDLRVNSYI